MGTRDGFTIRMAHNASSYSFSFLCRGIEVFLLFLGIIGTTRSDNSTAQVHPGRQTDYAPYSSESATLVLSVIARHSNVSGLVGDHMHTELVSTCPHAGVTFGFLTFDEFFT